MSAKRASKWPPDWTFAWRYSKEELGPLSVAASNYCNKKRSDRRYIRRYLKDLAATWQGEKYTTSIARTIESLLKLLKYVEKDSR